MRTTLARILGILITLAAIGGVVYGVLSGLVLPIVIVIGVGGVVLAALVALIITPTD